MERISIVGSPGSGKSSLLRALGAELDAPVLELDGVFHQAGWTPLPTPEFIERVAAFTSGERWVVDGNYATVRATVWARADTLVWLDLPLHVCLRRVLRRTLGRAFHRTKLWNGNRETLLAHLWDRDAIIWWTLHSYGRRQREYAQLFSTLPQSAPQLRLYRLRSPAEVAAFLESVQPTSSLQ